MTSERKWLPSDWLDEENPAMQASPDGYIERDGDGWALRLPADDPERDNDFYHLAIEPGQVVDFTWCEPREDRALTVFKDRSWVVSSPPPDAATHFYEHSTGTLASSVDELAEELIIGDPSFRLGYSDPVKPGKYVVAAYTWSESIPFHFEVDAEGKGHFLSCTGVN